MSAIAPPTAAAQQQDSSLVPPRVITNPGPEFDDSVRQFQGIPGVERAPGGRLWATWYSGGDTECAENYVLLVTSADGGETWSPPAFIVDPVPPEIRAFDPCLWLDPQGRLWLFWAHSRGLRDGRFGVWAMHAADADSATPAWSTPRRLGDGIMMNKPTVAANGDWHLPVSIWPPRSAEHPPDEFNPCARTGAWDVVSRDNGATFEYLGKADDAERRVFDEHMLVERRDGSWWMLSRVIRGIWENVSLDGGRTWPRELGRFSPIPHINSRFYIRRLASGNLLLVRHHQPPSTEDWPPRSHLTAFLSTDDGASWQGGLLLDERAGVSYPDGTQMPDGTLHVIYDYQRTRDKHILLATFTESDVLAGQWQSPRARARQLVNRATAVGRDGPA
ncbi:hypothetical protein DB346_05675 [Verrucomicrobia bacterium LW23]|nr:hypothetical protein DB346_05675 [Verrucomicrobia bacterium LW23]